MIRLIVNVGMILAVTVLVGISLVLVIKVLNWLVQWVAEQFGYEVGDFFRYVRSKLPEKKSKPIEPESRPDKKFTRD